MKELIQKVVSKAKFLSILEVPDATFKTKTESNPLLPMEK